MVFVVLADLAGRAGVTKYSLEQMAFFAPIAVVVVGATVGLVLLWVKIAASRCVSAARVAAPPDPPGAAVTLLVREPVCPSADLS